MMKKHLIRRMIFVITIAMGIMLSISACNSATTESTPQPMPLAKKVIGYYASWSAYSGYTPDKIDANKLTNINYAFANIGKDLKVAMGYPDIDPSNFKLLNALKQKNPNLKTLISIGGWTWSGKFSDAALTDASRTAFADSCVAFITQYGFDGVDIDWEYPVSGGLSNNTKRPEDKQDFTLLLQKIREKLDARGLIDNKHYLLTIAGGAVSSYISNTDISVLQQYLDYANIIAYDIHGTWESYTDFNAPLYNNSDVSPQSQDKWSVDSGINAWLKAGFPADKIVLGIPFYGCKYDMVKNTNNGLYQSFSGGSELSYDSIVKNYLNSPGYKRYFHKQSMVPWLFNGSTFISYEDPQSIGFKNEYIKSKGLAGAMIWELSQDKNKVLLNAIYEGLK
jgi:chitinase